MLKRFPRRHLGIPCCALVCSALYRLKPGLLFQAVPARTMVTTAAVAPIPLSLQRRRSLGLAGRSAPGSTGSKRGLTASAATGQRVGETAHVLSIATEYRQEAVILQRSAKLLGYKFQFCGLREKWIGWGTKLVQYRRALRRGLEQGSIAPTDPVLCIDGWDCALIGSAQEFIDKMALPPFSDNEKPWFAGERICGPDFFKASRIDAVYDDPGTPWRYPNAGCMAGRAMPVLQLVEALLAGSGDGSEPFPEDGNDQGRLHEYLLELGERGDPVPYLVDSRCGIFQCLYEAEPQWRLEDTGDSLLPRLRNVVTGELPIVLHGNGHTGRWFLSNLWREMDFLRKVGLTVEELAHLPHDGPVAPGTVPDEATEKNWLATFQLYRIIETQMAYARVGVEWDPWKIVAEQGGKVSGEETR
eukprot:gb/GFBE01035579.1/.p1 GENE.gb/GFBE01035579.1/~~gb/GFBE01035579.1/.p1  ORF type:complete len:415 (+),score=49.22 gb/GFBE01035579.1/:1-1245(+)